MDDLKPHEINGVFDDDGYEINSDLIKKPGLCLTCLHDSDWDENPICNLIRFDQQDEEDFICHGYKKI